MPAPYTRNGKQVLHTVDNLLAAFADGVSERAAAMIVRALEIADAYDWTLPDTRPVELPQLLDPRDDDIPELTDYDWTVIANVPRSTVRVRGIMCRPTQQGDEYACSCGVRWDVSEGKEAHP